MKMYGDNEEYRDQLNEAKKQWLTANNLYKKLLQECSCVLGGPVNEDRLDHLSNFSQHSSLKRPKKRRRVSDDDADEDLLASSSSGLQDGLYCMPLKDNALCPSTVAAIRKSEENEVEENADEEDFLFT